MRLDKFLSQKYPDLSRSYLQKLITDGKVHVNQQIANKTGQKINNEDQVLISIPKAQKLEIKAEDIKLDIIYEDQDMIIINKAPSMVVHPSASGDNLDGTLVNAVMHHCEKELSGIGGVLRPGIVHRLDKDTSGLIMVAKNDTSHQYLSEIISQRKIEKYYLAIVHGQMSSKKGTIDAPISRNHINRQKMAIAGDKHGKSAISHFEVKHYSSELDLSLLKVQILTGRTHQIRVHLSSIGHPVAFDKTYGNPRLDKILKSHFNIQERQLLHAWQLRLRLANKKSLETFEAPIPNDFKVFTQLFS